MSYANEHTDEAERLEWQAKQNHYRVDEEFSNIQLKKFQKVLDAGCGTGLVSRYLLDRENTLSIDACDFSELRAQQAKNYSKEYPYTKINFIVANLEKINAPDEHYDVVVSRYVYEHLQNPLAVSQELYRVLQKNGKINIVDFDGIFVNLFSLNKRFNYLFDQLKNNFTFDLNIGRKIPSYLKSAGFRNVEWKVSVEQFMGVDLKTEYTNNKERMRMARATIEQILGSAALADEFTALYLQEMMKEENTLFYNKFVVSAQK